MAAAQALTLQSGSPASPPAASTVCSEMVKHLLWCSKAFMSPPSNWTTEDVPNGPAVPAHGTLPQGNPSCSRSCGKTLPSLLLSQPLYVQFSSTACLQTACAAITRVGDATCRPVASLAQEVCAFLPGAVGVGQQDRDQPKQHREKLQSQLGFVHFQGKTPA